MDEEGEGQGASQEVSQEKVPFSEVRGQIATINKEIAERGVDDVISGLVNTFREMNDMAPKKFWDDADIGPSIMATVGFGELVPRMLSAAGVSPDKIEEYMGRIEAEDPFMKNILNDTRERLARKKAA